MEPGPPSLPPAFPTPPSGTKPANKPASTGAKIAGGCFLAFVLVVGGCVALAVMKRSAMTPSEREAEKQHMAELRRGMNDATRSTLQALAAFRRQLPAVEGLQPKTHVLSPKVEKFTYTFVDYPWLSQFTDAGFQLRPNPESKQFGYRGSNFESIQEALVKNGKIETEPSGFWLRDLLAKIQNGPPIAVIVPLEQAWPVLNADRKSYKVVGNFRGWLILVDPKSLQPLGQAPVQAQNSGNLSSLQVRVMGVKMGSSIEEVVATDLKEKFWSSADAAVASIIQQPVDTVAHSAY